jgi:hypothetical protein
MGKVKVKTKEALQRADTEIETPIPRIRFGKISEIKTQVTGARESA